MYAHDIDYNEVWRIEKTNHKFNGSSPFCFIVQIKCVCSLTRTYIKQQKISMYTFKIICH